MSKTGNRAALVAAALILAMALPAVSFAQGNLYQEIESHKEKITWREAKPDLPSEVCGFFSTCDDNKPAKLATLPPTTIEGHQVGRAIYWTHMKGKDAFILEHQTREEAYFFLLAPNGTLSMTVYLERGKPFYLVANETGQSKFDRDKADWEKWAMKSGAEK